MRPLISAAILIALAQPAAAACPDVSLMQNAARGWLAGQRLPDPLVRTPSDAACAYAVFRGILEHELGPPVGVKVGLASARSRDRFGVDTPATGTLFAPMLLPDGARLSLSGSRSAYFEADLIVTVGSSAINRAQTREEVAAALRDIRPFIEVPDLALRAGVAPRGPLLMAYGLMPWRGVLGKGIAISDMADPVAELGALNVVLRVDGNVLETANGDSLMGHPLDVLLWLIDSGQYELKPGSVVSLGALSEMRPAFPGHRVEAEYVIGNRTMKVGTTLVP